MRTDWVISELYYPEQNATGHFLTGIAEALVDAQSQVSVLCAQPSYNQRGVKAPKLEERNGVTIRRCWSTSCDPRKILGRLLNFVSTSISIALRGLYSIQRNDRVLVVTNPPLLPFLFRLVCWLKGARFVLLVHDVYPDVFVPLGILKPKHTLYKIMSWLNRKLYASSNHVVVLGRDMARLVENKSQGRASVSVIPNWGDVGVIKPVGKSSNPLLKRLGLEDKFIVHYSGNHGRTHDLVTLVDAAAALQGESDIHFLFIGEGSGKAEAVTRSKQLGLQNVTFETFVDRSELNISLNASDISVLAFKSGMAGVSVPSRMYNLMAAGKPMIAIVDQSSEVAAVVHEENMGLVVPPDSPVAVADAISKLKTDENLREEMWQNARAAAVNKYSYDSVKDKYRELFNRI